MDGKSNKLLSLSEIPPLKNIDRTSLCAMIHKSYTPVSKAATYLAVVSSNLFAIFFSLVHDIGVCKCITNPNNSSYRNVTFLELKPILRLLFLLESEQFFSIFVIIRLFATTKGTECRNPSLVSCLEVVL